MDYEGALRLVLRAARGGDVGNLAAILREHPNVGAWTNTKGETALILASQDGEPECILALLAVSDPKVKSSSALRLVACRGLADCVRVLIPLSDSKDSDALRWAAAGDFEDCVEMLIPVSDPGEHRSMALREALGYGSLRCARLLLPFADMKIDGRRILKDAMIGGNLSFIQLLLPLMSLAVLKEKDESGKTVAEEARRGGKVHAATFVEQWIRAQEEQEELSQTLPIHGEKEIRKTRQL